MNVIFDRIFSDQTKDVKDKLKKQYITKEKEAPSRIKKGCFDIMTHFIHNIKPNDFKAMKVASSREAAYPLDNIQERSKNIIEAI